jgi:glycosyltransferase involved in cell wall biosynthesis
LLLQLTGGELVSLPDLNYGSWRSRRGRMAIGFAARNARIVTVATEPMRILAESRGISADVVPLGVALDAWPVRAPMPRNPQSRARLLHVADINPVKDHRTMLGAALWLRDAGVDFQLDFAGVDTLDGAVQAAASDLGLSDVTRWHRRLGRESLRKLFEDSDLLVLTSRHEAGPLAVLEAAVAGIPTVGTAVGHIAEWSPAAAVAVPCGDSAAMAAAISALLENDPARIAIAAEAQSRAVQHDADYTARRFEQLYQSMLA